jgi:His-Xaa-Ser system protein HxsD
VSSGADESENSPSSVAEGEEVELGYRLYDRAIVFDLSEELYPLDAIYGASYIFIDRCYVHLSRPGDAQVSVRLRRKEPTDAEALIALAGEFANELLNQVLRMRIARSTAGIREQYMARAFFSDRSQSTIDDLLAELDAEELEDESLEVSVPWETEAPTSEAPTSEDDSSTAGKADA